MEIWSCCSLLINVHWHCIVFKKKIRALNLIVKSPVVLPHPALQALSRAPLPAWFLNILHQGPFSVCSVFASMTPLLTAPQSWGISPWPPFLLTGSRTPRLKWLTHHSPWSLKIHAHVCSALVIFQTAEDHGRAPKAGERAVLTLCFTEHSSREMLPGEASVAKQIWDMVICKDVCIGKVLRGLTVKNLICLTFQIFLIVETFFP